MHAVFKTTQTVGLGIFLFINRNQFKEYGKKLDDYTKASVLLILIMIVASTIL